MKLAGANVEAKIYKTAALILFGTSAHYNFPIGIPSSEHIHTAKSYIERLLNILRGKELLENKKSLRSRCIALP